MTQDTPTTITSANEALDAIRAMYRALGENIIATRPQLMREYHHTMRELHSLEGIDAWWPRFTAHWPYLNREGAKETMLAAPMFSRNSLSHYKDEYLADVRKRYPAYITKEPCRSMDSVAFANWARKDMDEQAEAFIRTLDTKTGGISSIVHMGFTGAQDRLEGVFLGQDGRKWSLKAFYAGGFNIQRLHVRTTLRKIK